MSTFIYEFTVLLKRSASRKRTSGEVTTDREITTTEDYFHFLQAVRKKYRLGSDTSIDVVDISLYREVD